MEGMEGMEGCFSLGLQKIKKSSKKKRKKKYYIPGRPKTYPPTLHPSMPLFVHSHPYNKIIISLYNINGDC